MASYVTEIAFVDSNGYQRRLTRRNHREELYRYLHSFGALGIIYEMTMDIMEEYGVVKCIYKDVPWDFLSDKKQFDYLNSHHEYVSYFTDWKKESMTSLWLGVRYNEFGGDYSSLLQ